MMNRIKQMYKDFFGYRLNEAAYVPYNIMDFAKNKGPYAVALVKKAATWAEKSGKRISGGTAIGKNYSTIILDMKHQGAEIYINLDNETIELFGEEVYDAKSFAQVFKTMSDTNNIIFSINDEKLDDILQANHRRELEYRKDVTGDVYYILPIKEFDRFIDYASFLNERVAVILGGFKGVRVEQYQEQLISIIQVLVFLMTNKLHRLLLHMIQV